MPIETEIQHAHFQRKTWLEYGEESLLSHRAIITWLHAINATVTEGNLIEHVYCDKTELENLMIPLKIFSLDKDGILDTLDRAGFVLIPPPSYEVNEDFRAKLMLGEDVSGS